MRELAVLGKRGDVEIHALTFDDVGAAGVDELGDELHHALDVRSGARQRVGPAHPEAVHLRPVRGLVALRDLGLGAALLGGAGDDLVFHIGHVADEHDIEPAPFEVAPDDVELERGAAVPHVRHLVHRRPAHVDRDLPRVARNELDLLARERVVQPDHLASTLSSSATAQTATPSPRPMAPRPSPRLGFTDTRFCAPGSGNSGTSA